MHRVADVRQHPRALPVRGHQPMPGAVRATIGQVSEALRLRRAPPFLTAGSKLLKRQTHT